MDILEVSRDLVCLCRQGAITAINGAGARMLGASTTEELVGRRMDEFLVPEYGSMLKLFLSGMASEDKAIPTRILALDKSVKAVEMQTFRAREIAPDATVVVCREMGAEVEAAVRLREYDMGFRLLVDNALNMVVHVQDGVIRYVNRACVALLGADSPEKMMGRKLTDVLDAQGAVLIEGDGLRALAESGVPVPLSLHGADGAPVAVLARVTLVPSSQGLEVMIEAAPAAC
ncbi:MAG TPA: PAS domain-containing protein [Magnetospirillum sp.]|nr:PAS domain-containing protein [Magnetospirillum sp.]